MQSRLLINEGTPFPSLGYSVTVPQDAHALEARFNTKEVPESLFLRAGRATAEWVIDRPDVAQINRRDGCASRLSASPEMARRGRHPRADGGTATIAPARSNTTYADVLHSLRAK